MISALNKMGPRTATTLIVIGITAWVVYLVLSVADLAAWARFLTLAILGCAWVGCRALSRDIAERPISQVDEYELTLRHQVRNVGYLTALACLLALYLLFVAGVQLAERDNDMLLRQAPDLIFATFLLAAAGPTFLLTWRLRGRNDQTDDKEEVI